MTAPDRAGGPPLAGRRAVVTGASRGIGAAIAVALAAAGADVVGLHLGDPDAADDAPALVDNDVNIMALGETGSAGATSGTCSS